MAKVKITISRLVIKVLLVISGVSFLYPLIWMLTLSLKNKDEVFDNPFGLAQDLGYA